MCEKWLDDIVQNFMLNYMNIYVDIYSNFNLTISLSLFSKKIKYLGPFNAILYKSPVEKFLLCLFTLSSVMGMETLKFVWLLFGTEEVWNF